MFAAGKGIETVTGISYQEWENRYANSTNLLLTERVLNEGKLLHSEGFLDIYYFENAIYYVDKGDADISTVFFFHFTPKELSNLPEGRVQYGFGNLDFAFTASELILPYWDISLKEMISLPDGDYRVAKVQLPEYELLDITTGQFNDEGVIWGITISSDGFQ